MTDNPATSKWRKQYSVEVVVGTDLRKSKGKDSLSPKWNTSHSLGKLTSSEDCFSTRSLSGKIEIDMQEMEIFFA